MLYMLDTNICIFGMKGNPSVLQHITSHHAAEICISAITYSELCHGVENSQAVLKNTLLLHSFLASIQVLPFDAAAAETYGKVRTQLQRQGKPIGPLDTLIAAHGLAAGATVVTNNTREFSRVPNLQLSDWYTPAP